jgi:hypothetical protein
VSSRAIVGVLVNGESPYKDLLQILTTKGITSINGVPIEVAIRNTGPGITNESAKFLIAAVNDYKKDPDKYSSAGNPTEETTPYTGEVW